MDHPMSHTRTSVHPWRTGANQYAVSEALWNSCGLAKLLQRRRKLNRIPLRMDRRCAPSLGHCKGLTPAVDSSISTGQVSPCFNLAHSPTGPLHCGSPLIAATCPHNPQGSNESRSNHCATPAPAFGINVFLRYSGRVPHEARNIFPLTSRC